MYVKFPDTENPASINTPEYAMLNVSDKTATTEHEYITSTLTADQVLFCGLTDDPCSPIEK